MNQPIPSLRLLKDFDHGELPPEAAERLAQQAVEIDAAHSAPDGETAPAEFYAVLAESDAEFGGELALRQAQQALLDTPEPIDASLEQTLAEILFTETSARDWVLPQQIDAYEIERRLGRGAMGIVYRARHVNLKNIVAVKILSPEHTDSPRAVSLFYREMEALGKLQHPNVVQALHAGQAEGLHFLAMELVDGVDVSRVASAVGPLRIRDACEIVRQAAQGLDAANRQHLVHRDLKPSNLMITREGRVKVLDLGLASVRLEHAAETEENLPAGTADYMAPEQWETPSAADVRADVYSLGCTLYKLLVGRTPFFEASTVRQKMRAHATKPPQPITSLRDDAPSRLEAVVLKLLAKSPDDRYASPRALAEDLAPFCEGSNLAALVKSVQPQPEVEAHSDVTAHPQPDAGNRETPWGRQRWVWAATTAALALVLMAGIVIRITDKGEITITVDQPQATIQVGGREAESQEAGQPVTLKVRSGEYEVVVSKSGFEAQRNFVRVERGKHVHENVVLPRREQIVRDAMQVDLEGGPLAAVRLTPAADSAVVGGADGGIRVVDLTTQEETTQWQAHRAEVSEALALDVNPSGGQIVSGGRDGAIVVWDLATGERVRTLIEEGPSVLFVRISSDGKWLITGGMAKEAELWDLETFEHVSTLKGHQTWVRDAAFGPGNRFAVTCGNDTNILVWDLATHQMQGFLIGHTAPVSSIDLTADGRFAVTGSWDGTVRIWDIGTGSNLRTMKQHTAPVRRVWFLDDATVLSASEDHDLRVWVPARDGSSVVLRGHTRQVVDADLNSNGGSIVSAGAAGTLRVWEASPEWKAGAGEELTTLLASQDAIELDEPIAAWAIGPTPLVQVAVSSDDGQFAVVSRSGDLSIWNAQAVDAERSNAAERVASRREIDAPPGVTSIAYGPNGTLAIATRIGGVYTLAAGERIPTRIDAHKAWATSVAFMGSGDAIASSGLDGAVRLWSVDEQRTIGTFSTDDYWLHAVAVVGGDETTLYAAGTDGSIYAWRVGQDEPPLRYGEPFTWHAVLTLCVSDDNRYVAAAGAKGDIGIWDNVEGAFKRWLSTAESETGTAAPIHGIAFAGPDATYLVSAAEDGVIRVWHRSTGRPLQTLGAHQGATRAVAIAGDSLYSCGDDGVVRKWEMTWPE